MRLKVVLLQIIMQIAVVGLSQPAYNSFSAYPLPFRMAQSGIISPLRIATGYKTEIHSILAANYRMPNLGVKHHWLELPWEIQLASNHQIFYPSPWLNNPMLAPDLGIIDLKLKVPAILAFSNEIILSSYLKKKSICTQQNYLLTLKSGLTNALQFKEDSLYPLYKGHLVYIRNTVAKKALLWHTSVHFEMEWTENMDFFAEIQYFKSNYQNGYFTIEHASGLRQNINEKFTLTIAYKLSAGNYPSAQLLYFTPYADLIFRFRTKKIFREKGLFEKKMF